MIKPARLAITTHPHFASGRVLTGDESADERRGEVLVAGGKQYNGRLGKVDLCQVGVFSRWPLSAIQCDIVRSILWQFPGCAMSAIPPIAQNT